MRRQSLSRSTGSLPAAAGLNIQQAKEQIGHAVDAYLTRDEFGELMIPLERQRPVFLVGPPGIGKTAIMQQIAAEKGIGLVSYSMTHHTRQSALGLPFIARKTYGGREYETSEYTMSEIIASVYDMMERDKVRSGILFLYEINCVSETLAPAMLQFLQYKVFGQHRVPDGWIVVTAGNPPEYNNSVREFDVVTWDRLKRIDVEPDFDTWKNYAVNADVHPSILTYLEVKPQDFYMVESTVAGKTFVTARGWVDLSEMIRLYEQHQFPVDTQLIAQYLQNDRIARDFSVYYDLYIKYKGNYRVEDILAGKTSKTVLTQAKKAPFDERLSLLSLIHEALGTEFSSIADQEQILRRLMAVFKTGKGRIVTASGSSVPEILDSLMADLANERQSGSTSGRLSRSEVRTMRLAERALGEMRDHVAAEKPADGAAAFEIVRADFNARRDAMSKQAEEIGKKLEHAFDFMDAAFAGGNETLIFVTELTANRQSASYLARYGSDAYFRHNKDLLVYERQKELETRVDDLLLQLPDADL